MTSTVPEAIRGNQGLVASFTRAAVTKTFDGDLKSFEIGSDDKDDSDLTFLEASQGETKDYKVTTKAVQSTAVGSFWRYVWDDPSTEATVVYGPHGNAVPTPDKPHFLLTLKPSGKPPLGGEAKRAKDRYEWEYEWEVTAGPTLDDGS